MDEREPPLISSLLTAPSPMVRVGTRSRHIQRINESLQQSFIRPEDVNEFPSSNSMHFDSPRPNNEDGFAHRLTFSSVLEDSMTLHTTDVNHTTFEASSVMGNETFLRDENPGFKAASGLYQQFYDAYQSHPSEQQVFELLHSYENVCSDILELLRSLLKKNVHAKCHQISVIISDLQNERNTWRLVRTLYYDRINSKSNHDPDAMLMDTLGKKMSDKQIVELLYERDAFVRQMQLVVDWLESNSADVLEDKKLEENFLSNTGKAWENTLHDLQNRQKDIITNLDFKNSYITEMDPDAPLRQDCMLHDQDREDESKLLKFMFLYLRAGQLDEAERLAGKYGYFWLAAALEGWRLYHDPNFDTPSENSTVQPIEGNKYRDVWKVACWQTASEIRLPIYERALYAALCGNLSTLTSVCHAWEDRLWAYMRILLDIRIEQELQCATMLERCKEPLPNTYWNQVSSLEQIFKDLDGSTNKKLQEESKHPFHVIQKYVILDDVDGLIEEMYEWIKNQSDLSHHIIRFMAHFVLFFRTIGWSVKEELCIVILERYVKVLIEERHVPLVAAYVATLPPSKQIVWYAKFLEKITDGEEQQLCLKLAKEAGLNIPLITKQVVENIRHMEPTFTIQQPNLSEETTEEDRQKINALDWLIYETSQRAEAIRQANTLMRMFVLCGKLEAVREVLDKIPPDSLDTMIKQWKKYSNSDELPPEDDNTAREYLCFQAYLQAHNAFQEWFKHYHTGRPIEPERPSGSNVKFTQWVAYEAQVKQYEDDLKKWEWSLEIQTNNTVKLIYNVLLFVDGGWMVDQRTNDDIDEDRQMELSSLRKKCIPEMCFLIHSVLHASEKYRECLQLADIIACEKNKLYNEFSKHQLQDFLAKLRESALESLDKNLDPLAYTIQ